MGYVLYGYYMDSYMDYMDGNCDLLFIHIKDRKVSILL